MDTTELDEGSPCPTNCGGALYYPPVENCSCHINQPCASCIGIKLTCNKCGEYFRETEELQSAPSSVLPKQERPSHDFGNGKRIFDYGYDSRSGSTMVYTGWYEGNVTAQDIISFLGDGTFGHRGPVFYNGQFTYTKITD
ncbi:MAG: hypothetical protein ACYDHZ_00540 [Dehalococcoidia bacterium]